MIMVNVGSLTYMLNDFPANSLVFFKTLTGRVCVDARIHCEHQQDEGRWDVYLFSAGKVIDDVDLPNLAANVIDDTFIATGWLIENGKKQGEGLAYRFMDQGIPNWTPDHMQALRFARREDAEQFSAEDEEAMRIVEHAWLKEKNFYKAFMNTVVDNPPPQKIFLLVARPSGYSSTKYEYLTAQYDPSYKGWVDCSNTRLTDSGVDPSWWMDLRILPKVPT
jgi:hypothetical protein